MTRSLPARAAAVFLGTLLTGCAVRTGSAVVETTDTTRRYSLPYDIVWNAAVFAVQETGLALTVESREAGILLTSESLSAATAGSSISIYFSETETADVTLVEVMGHAASAADGGKLALRLLGVLDNHMESRAGLR